MSDFKLIDTHCHIHDSEFARPGELTADEQTEEARQVGVDNFICVGTDLKSSREAFEFSMSREGCFASLAIHPHEAADMPVEQIQPAVEMLEKIIDAKPNKIVAIGECGLDYYYHQDQEVKDRQIQLFKLHLELVQKHDLPLIFHIRDAFDDFFNIIDKYNGIRGVVHSFSATSKELEGILARGLYVGLNGIMTFTKQTDQLQAAAMVPLENLVLETDAPFLTPAPFRGKMCAPKHLRVTADFLSELRGESFEDLSKATTANAKKLFGI